MNKRLALIPITGLVLVTLAGCATTPNGTGADNQVVNSTTNTSQSNTVSNAVGNPSANGTQVSANEPTGNASGTQNGSPSSSNYAKEIAFIKGKGYSVTGAAPNASVQTSSGETLSAWIGVEMQGDGYNQFVFFFLNGKYLGTDTAKPSAQITSAKPAGTGSIAVTYPVYKKGDAFVKPTGTPVTITYHWDGAKLTPNKPYPKQFA